MEAPVPARGVWAIRPGMGFFLGWGTKKSFLFFSFCSASIPSRALKLKYFKENKKSFRSGSQPRAGWPVRLVLVRATPRAEVDVISVRRC